MFAETFFEKREMPCICSFRTTLIAIDAAERPGHEFNEWTEVEAGTVPSPVLPLTRLTSRSWTPDVETVPALKCIGRSSSAN